MVIEPLIPAKQSPHPHEQNTCCHAACTYRVSGMVLRMSGWGAVNSSGRYHAQVIGEKELGCVLAHKPELFFAYLTA